MRISQGEFVKKAFWISASFHFCLIAVLYWSTDISLAFYKKQAEKDKVGGAIAVDLLYKPSDSARRKGKTEKDRLPPPKVKTKKAEPERPTLVKKQAKKSKPKKQEPTKKEDPKKNFTALFDKMRQETGLDRKKKPRDDNFPTHELGEEKATGTGGESRSKLSPAQQALQSACRKYAQTAQADRLRKLYPDARGYINIRLVGIGNQLELVSLKMAESSGISALDQGCEVAIRKALQEETFASDIVAELSGREQTITCQF